MLRKQSNEGAGGNINIRITKIFKTALKENLINTNIYCRLCPYMHVQLTNSTPSFWRVTAFQEAMMLFISEVYLWQCTRVPISQRPHQHLLFFFTFFNSHSNDVEW